MTGVWRGCDVGVGPGPSRLRVNKPGPYGGWGGGCVGLGGFAGLGGGFGGRVGAFGEAVVLVVVDGGGDGLAPAVGAEGVDVFVLGEAEGLEEGLQHVGEGAGEARFYFAADGGGD